MKKYLVNLGATFTLVAPLVVTVACSDDSDTPAKYVDSTFVAETDPEVYKTQVWAVADGGSWTDGSFNQQTGDAVEEFTGSNQQKLAPSSSSTSDISTSITNAISNGAKVIVCSGYLHNEALKELTVLHPEVGFIFVDDVLTAVNEKGEELQQGNVASWMYDMKEASFVAGYYAAEYANEHPGSDSKAMVSSFGGMDIPSVTDFMIGFEEGVGYWNSLNPDTKVTIYDDQSPFIGNFEPDENGEVSTKTDSLVKAGVDVILPVGGPQALTVLNKVDSSYDDTEVMVIGVDTRLDENFEVKEEAKDHILGSVTKDIKNSILSTLYAIYDYDGDSYDIDKELLANGGADVFGEVYLGDMANGYTGFYDNIGGEWINVDSNKEVIEAATSTTYPTTYEW